MVESGGGYDPLDDQFALAEQLEKKEQWEPAYKNYHDVASKALQQIANTTDANR